MRTIRSGSLEGSCGAHAEAPHPLARFARVDAGSRRNGPRSPTLSPLAAPPPAAACWPRFANAGGRPPRPPEEDLVLLYTMERTCDALAMGELGDLGLSKSAVVRALRADGAAARLLGGRPRHSRNCACGKTRPAAKLAPYPPKGSSSSGAFAQPGSSKCHHSVGSGTKPSAVIASSRIWRFFKTGSGRFM